MTRKIFQSVDATINDNEYNNLKKFEAVLALKKRILK